MKIGGNEFSQRIENETTVKTGSLSDVLHQGGESKHASPMSIPALLHQGGEQKHGNEAHKKAGGLINHLGK